MDLRKFTVVTVDNIDFLQRHAMVYCGDQSRSWHGTSVQVVQPSSSIEVQPQFSEVGSPPQSTATSNLIQSTTISQPQIQQSPKHKKVTRRSRSTSEFKILHGDIPALAPSRTLHPLQTINPLNAISVNQYADLKDNFSLRDFRLTAEEARELHDLKVSAFFYCLLRYV